MLRKGSRIKRRKRNRGETTRLRSLECLFWFCPSSDWQITHWGKSRSTTTSRATTTIQIHRGVDRVADKRDICLLFSGKWREPEGAVGENNGGNDDFNRRTLFQRPTSIVSRRSCFSPSGRRNHRNGILILGLPSNFCPSGVCFRGCSKISTTSKFWLSAILFPKCAGQSHRRGEI